MRAEATGSLSLRSMLPEDRKFFATLGAAAFGDFSRHAGPHTLELTARPRTTSLVAERNGMPIGFVIVECGPRTAWVQAIAVVREARGGGVGARLMRAAEALAQNGGCSVLRLTTAQANVEALELFLKRGFVLERRIARYYGGGQDACVLARSL